MIAELKGDFIEKLCLQVCPA